MVRSRVFIAVACALLVGIAAPATQAQAPTSSADTPKPSKLTMTTERVKEMLAKWRQNRPKLKACRAEARQKGLAGDDRWFFISECMAKS